MTPHKCPVCVGEGDVPDYRAAEQYKGTAVEYVTRMKSCPACKGACVLWEPEAAIPGASFVPWYPNHWQTTEPPFKFHNTTGGNYDSECRWVGSLS